MLGMSATTGLPLDGLDHVRQSIRDILTTRIGTRVERRDYGSDLPALIDRPMNAALKVDVYAATAKAIRKWEPRVEVTRVSIRAAAPGRLELALEGLYRPDGKPIRLEGIVVE